MWLKAYKFSGFRLFNSLNIPPPGHQDDSAQMRAANKSKHRYNAQQDVPACSKKLAKVGPEFHTLRT